MMKYRPTQASTSRTILRVWRYKLPIFVVVNIFCFTQQSNVITVLCLPVLFELSHGLGNTATMCIYNPNFITCYGSDKNGQPDKNSDMPF